MKSKTSSLRLLKETYEEIDSICDDIGCTRNDWIKEAVDEKLEGKKSQDQEVIEDTTPEPKPTIEIIETKEEPNVTEMKESQKITVELEPKPTVELIPKPNPPVTMIPVNGQWRLYTKRYNI